MISKVDTLISAIGEKVDTELLSINDILIDGRNNVIADQITLETSTENVFIGGDARRGPSTVIESAADGKLVAEEIIRREGLQLGAEPYFTKTLNRDSLIIRSNEIKGKIEYRIDDDINKEAGRCLHCNYNCNKCVDVCPNRANIAIKLNHIFKDVSQILHLDGFCNECGNCETFCPHEGSPYKDKLTLFSSHDDFINSTNSGFYIANETQSSLGRTVNLRMGANIYELVLDNEGNVIKSNPEENYTYKSEVDMMIKEVMLNYSYINYE